MDKCIAICELLQQHHVGRENAVCSKELQRLFLLDGRTLRRKINRLRQNGCPICSGPTGYFYASTQNEINETVCRLNQHITTVSNARTGLLYASPLPHSGLTLNITIDLKQGGISLNAK